MKAMYKSELARLAGVSSRTFARYLAAHREELAKLGVSPHARKLPPKAVRFVCEDYCIDLWDVLFEKNQKEMSKGRKNPVRPCPKDLFTTIQPSLS